MKAEAAHAAEIDEQDVELRRRLELVRSTSLALRDARHAVELANVALGVQLHAARNAQARVDALLKTIRGDL